MAKNKMLKLYYLSLECIQEHLDAAVTEIDKGEYYFSLKHIWAISDITKMLAARISAEH